MRSNYFKMLVLFMLFLPLCTGWAQFKNQVPRKPIVEEIIQLPRMTQSHSSVGFHLFDPDRFFMNQSYSMSAGFGGGNSGSMGMYLNNMTYLFSEKLQLSARFGFMHDPLKMGGFQNNTRPLDNMIYGADLTFRPKENMFFRISFNKAPIYNRYSNGYYNRYYNRYRPSSFFNSYLMGY